MPVSSNPAKYGLLAQDVTALKADQTAWATAYPAHVTAQDAAGTINVVHLSAAGDISVTRVALEIAREPSAVD